MVSSAWLTIRSSVYLGKTKRKLKNEKYRDVEEGYGEKDDFSSHATMSEVSSKPKLIHSSGNFEGKS